MEATNLIRSMNPTAIIIPAVNSVVPLTEILMTQRFTEEFARGVSGWMEDIASGVKHIPETLEYGIGSFLYTADRPFHPQRLHDWVDTMYFWKEISIEVAEEEDNEDEEEPEKAPQGTPLPETAASADVPKIEDFGEEEKRRRNAAYGNFFRSKGFVWLGNPNRVDHVVEWSQAGTVLTIEYASPWSSFGAMPSRGQRLVFIGQDIKKEALKRDLDALLLTDEEWTNLQQGSYGENPLPDPFEPFPTSDMCAHRTANAEKCIGRPHQSDHGRQQTAGTALEPRHPAKKRSRE
jgi:G3E family GTPase